MQSLRCEISEASVVKDLRKQFTSNDDICHYKMQTEEGTNVYAHLGVLALASEYINTLINSKFCDSNLPALNLVMIPPTPDSEMCLNIITKLIYSENVRLSADIAIQLLPWIDYLRLNNLKKVCQYVLFCNLRPELALDIYFVSSCFGLEVLEQASAEIVRSRFEDTDILMMRKHDLSTDGLIHLFKHKFTKNCSKERLSRSFAFWMAIQHDMTVKELQWFLHTNQLCSHTILQTITLDNLAIAADHLQTIQANCKFRPEELDVRSTVECCIALSVSHGLQTSIGCGTVQVIDAGYFCFVYDFVQNMWLKAPKHIVDRLTGNFNCRLSHATMRDDLWYRFMKEWSYISTNDSVEVESNLIEEADECELEFTPYYSDVISGLTENSIYYFGWNEPSRRRGRYSSECTFHIFWKTISKSHKTFSRSSITYFVPSLYSAKLAVTEYNDIFYFCVVRLGSFYSAHGLIMLFAYDTLQDAWYSLNKHEGLLDKSLSCNSSLHIKVKDGLIFVLLGSYLLKLSLHSRSWVDKPFCYYSNEAVSLHKDSSCCCKELAYFLHGTTSNSYRRDCTSTYCEAKPHTCNMGDIYRFQTTFTSDGILWLKHPAPHVSVMVHIPLDSSRCWKELPAPPTQNVSHLEFTYARLSSIRRLSPVDGYQNMYDRDCVPYRDCFTLPASYSAQIV